MPEILIEKLFSEDTEDGHLAVYKTEAFGLLLTLSEHILLSESDGFFAYEMLSHPALFIHSKPQKVAVMGAGFGILSEVLKHPSVQEVHCVIPNPLVDDAVSQFFPELHQAKHDNRIRWHHTEFKQWLHAQKDQDFDVLIEDLPEQIAMSEPYQAEWRVLKTNGILVQSCHTSLLHLKSLKPIFQEVHQVGFGDCHTLNFPQASFSNGWRTAILATKSFTFNHLSEKDVYNRTFSTRYYNFDTHKAALALPEFIRQELEADWL